MISIWHLHIHSINTSSLDDREALLRELNALTSADISDFTTLIKESNGTRQNQDPADIILQHTLAAQDVGDKLTSSVIAQQDLLKEILIGNENFVRARKSDPVTVKRDAMVCDNMLFITFSLLFFCVIC